MTARTIPDSDAAGRDVVAEAVAYLREEADFNRSWTDGRRECTISGVHADKDGYVARRKELADRADGFADAIERLREELEVAKATEREACAKEADGFAEQAAKEGWTGKNIASRTATAIGRAIRARAASPATVPARPAVPEWQQLAEKVRHNEKLVIWGEELLWALECWIVAPESYQDGVECAQAAKAEIRRIVECAFELAASPSPGRENGK